MSHLRSKRKVRCLGCGLHPGTCACAQFPRLRFRTPLAILQHVRERYKPTNTGRMLARMVEGTPILPWGMREPAFNPGPLQDPSIEWHLLFPREGAPLVDPEKSVAQGRRVGFVLLDGSWHQCSHISRRLPAIAGLPCVALPPGARSFWTVRSQPHEQGKSTLEAGAQLLELFEGREAVAPLLRAFAGVTARLLHLKGRLRSPEIPAGWLL
ncbi:MAG TPA: tRNA-uridine aminocarboxypropyltransferase [Planctomycetota bacterium]|nr:tRNA-uridine aminocarboxypropyltransferase [Planctomycetota bacterium]